MAKENSVVASIVKSLQDKFGEENITYLGNKKAVAMERISSGSFSLDNAKEPTSESVRLKSHLIYSSCTPDKVVLILSTI